MSAITAEIHIDTSIQPSETPLPATPIPLANSAADLTPSTQLNIPITGASNSTKPDHLAALADAMDASRAHLNQILTSWKDWAGKADATPTNTKNNTTNDDDEEEEDEDDEEE